MRQAILTILQVQNGRAKLNNVMGAAMAWAYATNHRAQGRGSLTTSAISMLMAKQTNTTTSFTITTAMVKDENGPLPSVSFSTAIYITRTTPYTP
jgi:hypothetical protein